MSKEQESLKSLQGLLNGEAIAIHTYDTFIPEINDPEMQVTFQEIRTGHRRHLDQLTRRIEELGDRPRIQQNLGMRLGRLYMDTRTWLGIAPDKMTRWVLQGEDMGLNAAEELVKGDLDEVSNELVGSLLCENAEYINRLMGFIHD